MDVRLVLQFSQEFKKKFEEDTNGNINKADDNWRKTEAG